MIPRITIGLVVIVLLAYVAGARYPGIASKFGLA